MNMINILIGFLGMLVLAVIIVIIWLGKNNQQSSSQVKNTNVNPNTPAVANNTTATPSHGTTPKAKSSLFGQIFRTIFIIALVIGIILFIVWAFITGVGMIKKFFNEEKPIYDWVEIKSDTVPLTTNYGKVYKIDEKMGFSLEGATVPYFSVNRSGVKIHGNVGEKKVGAKFPNDSPDNYELRFKSDSLQTGILILKQWRYQIQID